MKTIKVTMYMDIVDDFVNEAKKWEHHIESLVDVDNYPEISIYHVQVDEEE